MGKKAEVKRMAKKRKEDPPKPGAAWMNTFADLMNLLLCFFVLLFSMSTIDAQKFEQIAASFSQSFSIFSGVKPDRRLVQQYQIRPA